MRFRTRGALAVVGALSTLAVAVAAQGATDDKVIVCHSTASADNVVVLIEVSRSALGGHLDSGQVVGQGHGQNMNQPDEWAELDGTGGSTMDKGFTSEACRTLYEDTYGGGDEE